MKTAKEAMAIQAMCDHVGRALEAAGLPTVLTYDNSQQLTRARGAVEGAVNVNMSSVQACVIDVFTQLLPAVKNAVY